MKFITRNLGWKLLSLAIAFALWVAVAREPELATSLSVPIEFKNIPEDLDVIATNDRVRIEVRGPSGRLSLENLRDAALVLDLADARPGERTYTILTGNAKLPSDVSFYRAIPSQVTVRFDRLMTRSTAIEPYFRHAPEGYRIESVALTPDKVNLRGPEDRLKNFTRVLTDPVELTGVVGEAKFRTHLNIGDPQVRLESPTVVTIEVKLEKIDARK